MIKDIEDIIKKLPSIPIYLSDHNSDYTERIIHNAIIMGYESYYDNKDLSTDFDLINLVQTCKDISCELHCRSGLYYYLSDLQYTLTLAWRNSKKKKTNVSEKDYEELLINNWDNSSLGMTYHLVKSQHVLPDRDMVDILAKDIESGRDVIIELKKGSTNGYKQLRSYATFFHNPILINISVDEVNSKRNDIIYFTFRQVLAESLIKPLLELDKQYNEIKDTLKPLFEVKRLER